MDFITKPISAYTFHICNSISTLETFGIMILIESKVQNCFMFLFQVILLLLLLLLFYKQGGKQVMGRHSMGIGLGLFSWLYPREQSSVTPAVTLDKTITELIGAGSSVWCQ